MSHLQEAIRTSAQAKAIAHLRITAAEAKELYLSGLFTTHAYLYILIRSQRKDGWWFTIEDIPAFCAEWGMPERSFYRAKNLLISKGHFEEKIKGSISLCCPSDRSQENSSATSGSGLQEVAEDCNKWQWTAKSGSTTAKSGSTTAKSGSTTAKSGRETHLEALLHKESGPSSDLSHTFFTDLLQETADKSLDPDKQPTANSLITHVPETREEMIARVRAETLQKIAEGRAKQSRKLGVTRAQELYDPNTRRQPCTANESGHTSVSHAETRGSSLTHVLSDQGIATRLMSRSSAMPAPPHSD